jgi:hypothetical protein
LNSNLLPSLHWYTSICFSKLFNIREVSKSVCRESAEVSRSGEAWHSLRISGKRRSHQDKFPLGHCLVAKATRVTWPSCISARRLGGRMV